MKNLTKVLLLCITTAGGILLFQAQDYNGYDFRYDNVPNMDKPTRESFTHFSGHQYNGEYDVITDAQGFDNFDMGIDNCETNVVTNPSNPLWIFTSVNGSGTPQNGYRTTNGGINWTVTNPAYPSGTCCDPWSTYLSNGTLVYGSGVSGQYVHRSTNNGLSWMAPVLSVNGFDRNTLASEQTGTGPFANYVYASITGSGGAPFARSTDNGATWTTTTTLSPHSAPGVMIAVGPNGSTNGGCVITVTTTGPATGATYTFHRSTDGGMTFTTASSLTVAGYSGSWSASSGRLHVNFGRHRTYPMIAMDNSNGPFRGRLYLVYSSNIPAGDGNKPDIKLQYSTDMGSTWSSYIVVNDNPNPELSDQWFPAVWCERNTGKLYVKWYDDRENPAAFLTSVWASYSTTGGTTWATSQKVSNSSFSYPCPTCGSGVCYRGDYDAITANPKVGFATWYDGRNCTFLTMGGYFPDYAMTVNPPSVSLNGTNDSQFVNVSIPAVKLYSDTVNFTATVPNPGLGSITLTFLNRTTNTVQNSLTSFPDSLRLRIRTSGGVPAALYNVRVQGNGPNGTPVHVRYVTVNVGLLGLQNNNLSPSAYYLYQNYPNPFNPVTNIKFDIPKTGNVKLNVYDITGKVTATLVDEIMGSGSYSFDFNAAEFSSGIYFYKLESEDYTYIRKMILVK
jgi:Secretion system C-terminal sorting domain